MEINTTGDWEALNGHKQATSVEISVRQSLIGMQSKETEANKRFYQQIKLWFIWTMISKRVQSWEGSAKSFLKFMSHAS